MYLLCVMWSTSVLSPISRRIRGILQVAADEAACRIALQSVKKESTSRAALSELNSR